MPNIGAECQRFYDLCLICACALSFQLKLAVALKPRLSQLARPRSPPPSETDLGEAVMSLLWAVLYLIVRDLIRGTPAKVNLFSETSMCVVLMGGRLASQNASKAYPCQSSSSMSRQSSTHCPRPLPNSSPSQALTLAASNFAKP